ncbi:carbohydrate ABC transporter permease [Mahella sp.]|uniref:carbohydrate ABC transporter permease n=1 Tax=Mahella sp. TaxID=2798721 RepID=UPI0025B96A12|nr:carbohydrate ABC transporter permease [Mahella sp.]MBZ4665141.1 ycjP 5 [Mahella sp.]
MTVKIKNKASLILEYTVMIAFTILCLYPIVWLFINSFKTNKELFADPWGLPNTLSLQNYVDAFVKGKIGTYFFNSVFIAVCVLIFGILLSSMAAYAISRMKWKLSKVTLNIFLLGLMIPIYASIVPLFSIFNALKILNTPWAVIIAQVAGSFPMAMFILTGFFTTIPNDMEEAAVIDGCGILRIFFNIIMPISKSSIVTVAVIIFLATWNDLLLPQILLSDPAKMTLPVGLMAFQGQYTTNYVGMIAAVIVTIIPTIIVYIFLHNNIMEGMVAGAVKG